MDTPIVDKIVSPGKPKSNDADDLANWFIDRLGLETYWMGKFWGRFSGGDNWGSHALGKAEGKTPYKIGLREIFRTLTISTQRSPLQSLQIHQTS